MSTFVRGKDMYKFLFDVKKCAYGNSETFLIIHCKIFKTLTLYWGTIFLKRNYKVLYSSISN